MVYVFCRAHDFDVYGITQLTCKNDRTVKPDRHKEVFSPHVRVVSKCALNKSRLRTKSVCFFVFNRYNEDVRFAH